MVFVSHPHQHPHCHGIQAAPWSLRGAVISNHLVPSGELCEEGLRPPHFAEWVDSGQREVICLRSQSQRRERQDPGHPPPWLWVQRPLENDGGKTGLSGGTRAGRSVKLFVRNPEQVNICIFLNLIVFGFKVFKLLKNLFQLSCILNQVNFLLFYLTTGLLSGWTDFFMKCQLQMDILSSLFGTSAYTAIFTYRDATSKIFAIKTENGQLIYF